ncbi:MAG TPA: hypothetical protein VIX12_06945 [Candidatus Binataceae bacterium]
MLRIDTVAIWAAIALAIAGCAAIGTSTQSSESSVQTLEYYPFQVKGYQNSYPHRSMLVLVTDDTRDFSDAGAADHSPQDGNPAIGVVTDHAGTVYQRLYSSPLGAIVQTAIARSAGEAGLESSLSPETAYQPGKKMSADYVLASKVVRCWVRKRVGADGRYGPVSATAATFSLDVTVYKPPFRVPFWEGKSQSTYDDPPVGSFGLGPEDEAGIYDEPGQVLSVALTRAVAGIFSRPELHTLIDEDQVRPR